MPLTQDKRLLSIKVDGLGENDLLLQAFTGDEEMSRLFRFQLELISDNNSLQAADVVGKNVTFGVNLTDGTPRYFNGFISQFVAGDEEDGRRNYRAEVVPWLWFLTQTADCRIFQEMTVQDILEKIFGDLGFSDFTFKLNLNHKTWEYCVQYRETDFNFASRLMEQEGIFYFFQHENGKHTLVLADHKGAYEDCGESEVSFFPTIGSAPVTDHITTWEHRYEFRSGKVMQRDYNFKTPSTDLTTKTNSVVKLPGIDKYEVYDYPGEYPDKGVGDGETKIRMEEIEAAHDVVLASSRCKTFTPGGKFKIDQHPAGSEKGKSFVITTIRHTATEPLAYETGAANGEDYRNSFSCIPDSVTFRSARLTTKPLVTGVQTAMVTGPSGEEIYTDEFGRVKVQFHWDREGQRDENTSCWIRVSQVHAGRSFGGIDLPRIGEEVIVAFLEGDPDQPIVVGRVYNAEALVPFKLPDEKVVSGMKSNSTKGGGGYNEYVMNDTKGNELIREHAQFDKDSTIENDLREHVLNNRSRDVSVDETIAIGANQKIDVGGNRVIAVVGNQQITISGNEKETYQANHSTDVAANQKTTVGAKQDVTVASDRILTVGANRTTNVASNDSLTVGGKETISVTGEASITSAASITLSVGGASIKIEAAKITIGVGSSGIEITPAGVTVSGPKITSAAAGIQEITGALVKIN